MQFTEQDQDQILAQGVSSEQIDKQIAYFVNGFPYLNVIKAATIGDGIVRIDDDQLAAYIHRFDTAAHERDLVKFVPASGAATRMFKSLFAALDGKSDKATDEFFARLTDFAFYDDLKAVMADKGEDLDKAVAENDWQPALRQTVLRFLLTDQGLEYGSLPKGLLKFHRYSDGPRTPVEEHLVEGAAYANSDGLVKLHFTVSPEHRERFETLIDEQRADYEAWLGVTFAISFSEQKKSTDTISVNPDNSPFRNPDGSLLFRPAGHGALIENLNDIDADIVFIKNIDNVVPDDIKEQTVTYKKVLAAVLLDAQQQIARLQGLLEGEHEVSDGYLAEADELFRRTLFTLPPEGFENLSKEEKLAYFRKKLDRPVRACGMVKNVGEPGGGPFWARNQDGSVSLQVVESAQIDLDNPQQKAIFDEATHFNPVDLVCGLKDHHGRKYDLVNYRDPLTGFITAKSKDGKELKAQELPGLWNGAMADWNTIFVEVPLITFNPVKTVNDLLRKEHQPQ
ncbi:DUF4301 family protein [Spirosoma agri]|uniref:DUF4301 family protein n=1 Tax=Spirosoma agri TaxID=1987381 RepID=A0A6M0IB03_9BACT|nr:DUF4301 family protein [Spirosoma agri]NEU65316.1 DUF4301 family protein [Spirosoma agri]